jgi:hypothetical protein
VEWPGMVKGYGGESHKKQVNAKDNTVKRRSQ